jgi:hypothetical protein
LIAPTLILNLPGFLRNKCTETVQIISLIKHAKEWVIAQENAFDVGALKVYNELEVK